MIARQGPGMPGRPLGDSGGSGQAVTRRTLVFALGILMMVLVALEMGLDRGDCIDMTHTYSHTSQPLPPQPPSSNTGQSDSGAKCPAACDCARECPVGGGGGGAAPAASPACPPPERAPAEKKDAVFPEFPFDVPYQHPDEHVGPPEDYRGPSPDKCPTTKPLCRTRVALIMVGHVRGATEGNRMETVKRFIAKCREEVGVCDLFIHTWRYEKFMTKTWNTPVPSLGKQTDLNFLCRELNCTGMFVERQDLTNIDGNRDWGKGGVSYEGSRMVPYALYAANVQRKLHNARFGKSHDVVFRIRPDYFRTAHGDVMPSGNFRHCVSNMAPDTVYGIGRYVPGGSVPRSVMGNGQVRRPWNGNSGDNFFYARADVFDRIFGYWMQNFGNVQESTLKWNELNPEADIGTVMERLHIKVTTCG